MSGDSPAIRWMRAIFPPVDPDPRERGLLHLHLAYATLSGVTLGVLNLADAIFVKTLGASPFEVTIFSIWSGVAFLAALFWSAAMRERSKAPFVIIAAIAGRLGLGLIGISASRSWFIFIYAVAWLAQGLIVTAQTSLVQRAYPERVRGRLFGLTLAAMTLARLITTVAAGWLLDWNENSYVAIFAVSGALGLVGAGFMARMEHRMRAALPPDHSPPRREPSLSAVAAGVRSMGESVALVRRIFREDHRYRRFQRNFFLYGIAFLLLTPVIPLFLVRNLQLDYGQIGIAKGLMGQIGLIVLPPLFGSMHERVSPSRFCARAFGLLALFPALLLLSAFAPGGLRVPSVYVAFLVMGAAMAAVDIAWHISSIHFAGREDPSAYQAVHVSLTGVRGSVAPLIGYGLIALGRVTLAFVISFTLFGLAAGLMNRMARAESAVESRAER